MVVTALDGLPEELGQLMRNVAVTVEHRPGPPGLLGLYEGIPLTSRTSQYAGVLPDRITIYRQAICAICRTEQEVDDQVRRTVIHEIAHHFGIDDNRLSQPRFPRSRCNRPPAPPTARCRYRRASHESSRPRSPGRNTSILPYPDLGRARPQVRALARAARASPSTRDGGRRGESQPGPHRRRWQPALARRVADRTRESPSRRARTVDSRSRARGRRQARELVRLVRALAVLFNVLRGSNL